MIKGRRTSPETGVGPLGEEMASGSGDDTPEEETGVLRRRGGGKGLSLDEAALLSGGGEGSASGDFPTDGCGTAKVDVSGMASVGGRSECTVVTLTSSSAGTMVGFAV